MDFDTIKKVPCHPKNRGGTRPKSAIKYLVYHYTANDGDSDTGNAHYFQNQLAKPSSAHYFVDDDSITQSVDDLQVAYAVGGNKYADTYLTGGGKLYGVVTNYNSLSIEMCDSQKDGQVMASEATMQRAAELGQALMEKYNIPIERVVRHFDVNGKYCPKYFMDNSAWELFKGRLTAQKEEDMKLYQYVKDLPYGKKSVTKAINNGYIRLNEDGSMGLWEANIQTVILMDRAGMLDNPPVNDV